MLPYCSPRNPVDATAQAVSDFSILTRCVAAMMSKGGYDMFAGIFGSGPSTKTFAEPLREAILKALGGQEQRVKALTMSAPSDIVSRYEDEGFLVYEDGSILAKALGALARFRKSFDAAASAEAAPKTPRLTFPVGPLSEHTAKIILSEAGIRFPSEILVAPGEDIGAAAESIGLPVVLKISSPDIPHKTEVGGVAVNIRSVQEARERAAEILARAADKAPEARIEGIVVSPMLSGGVETIVGVARDPVFGPIVMFGLGGVFVEALKDVTFRVAPFAKDEAMRMIREIHGYPILLGVRGAKPADLDALADLLSKISSFAAAHADLIDSIDLNPVLALPDGVAPLDALIVLRDPAHD